MRSSSITNIQYLATKQSLAVTSANWFRTIVQNSYWSRRAIEILKSTVSQSTYTKLISAISTTVSNTENTKGIRTNKHRGPCLLFITIITPYPSTRVYVAVLLRQSNQRYRVDIQKHVIFHRVQYTRR